jgi:hypothetical protein
MGLRFAKFLSAGIVGIGALFLVGGSGLSRSPGNNQARIASQFEKITMVYPVDGSVFPPEITAPTFLWRDASEISKRWWLRSPLGITAVAFAWTRPVNSHN